MLGLGVGEIIIVALVLLVFVGPDQLPQFMRWMGRSYGQLRRAADDLRRAFVLEADRMDAEERYAKLEERRRRAKEARRQALENAGPGTVAHRSTTAPEPDSGSEAVAEPTQAEPTAEPTEAELVAEPTEEPAEADSRAKVEAVEEGP